MMSFCQKLIEAADARPDKVAMVMLGPNGAETTTFGEMLAQTRSLAYRLGQERTRRRSTYGSPRPSARASFTSRR